MKVLRMNEKAKSLIFQKLTEKFEKEYDNFSNNLNETKFSFNMDFTCTAKEKVQIIFDPVAFLKMRGLVDAYDTEIGWHGLVKKINDLQYYVYDVKMYKQFVSSAKIDTEDEDMQEFWDSLSDEEFDDLHFQAHSHVRMATFASTIDLQNQADIIKNMGKSGFYIFQIWNKNGDINTYLYDIDKNIMYDRNDVIIDFATPEGVVSDFVLDSFQYVQERKNQFTKTEMGGSKKKESSLLPGIWDGRNYDCEEWD